LSDPLDELDELVNVDWNTGDNVAGALEVAELVLELETALPPICLATPTLSASWSGVTDNWASLRLPKVDCSHSVVAGALDIVDELEVELEAAPVTAGNSL
jgi:hypothetical protein